MIKYEVLLLRAAVEASIQRAFMQRETDENHHPVSTDLEDELADIAWNEYDRHTE